jgi:hypothetical protein
LLGSQTNLAITEGKDACCHSLRRFGDCAACGSGL